MDNAQTAWLLSPVRPSPKAAWAALWSILVLSRRQGARHLAFLLFAALGLLAPRAVASENGETDAHARALAAFASAERDDEALAFGQALAGYEEALRLDPSMPRAMRAEQRAKTIRARSEGAYAPLAALERVRRDPKLSSDPLAIDELVRQANDFPPGLVRVEARVLAAEAYANRLRRPEDAVALWKAIVADPHAEAAVRRSTVAALVEHHLARGDYSSAQAALAAAPRVDEKLAGRVDRVVRRHKLHFASIAAVAAAFGLAARAILGKARGGELGATVARVRASSRLMLGYAAYVAAFGAILASEYEEGTARPFLLFGAVLVPLLFVARAWGALGASTRVARVARAVVCATSVLGAAFLVLEHVDVAYLEGIGL